MTRKPDYVVNVWGDGKLAHPIPASMWLESAFFHRSLNKLSLPDNRITHRIRVYLKPSAQEKRE